jgi:hypothetical protein
MLFPGETVTAPPPRHGAKRSGLSPATSTLTLEIHFQKRSFRPDSLNTARYANDGSGITGHVWSLEEIAGLLP